MLEETEFDFVNKLVRILSKHLHIEREIWSDCRNGRIDIVATTKEGYRFGIEAKRHDRKRGEEVGEYIKQAMRYSKYTFEGERIPIFIAPPLSYKYFILNEETKEDVWHKDRHPMNSEHHSFNGMLGSLGIGELRNLGDYYIFSFSNKVIWNSKKEWKSDFPKGTHIENYNKLLLKINS